MADGGPSAPGLAEPSRTDRASGIARVAVPALTREAGNWNPQTQTQAGRGVPTESQVSSRCVAGGRGAAGGPGARSQCFDRGRARLGERACAGAARRVVRCWEPSPRPGAGRPWGALCSGLGGWVWGGIPAHQGYQL